VAILWQIYRAAAASERFSIVSYIFMQTTVYL
jgi:hypothetical protein